MPLPLPSRSPLLLQIEMLTYLSSVAKGPVQRAEVLVNIITGVCACVWGGCLCGGHWSREQGELAWSAHCLSTRVWPPTFRPCLQ